MLAVSSGSLGLVVLLLEAGSDINAQDKVSGTRYASIVPDTACNSCCSGLCMHPSLQLN